MKIVAAVLLAFQVRASSAHAFGLNYSLPVPLRLYMIAAAFALAASFVLIALFARSSSPAVGDGTPSAYSPQGVRHDPVLLGVASLLLLLACICTGLFGTQDVNRNFNMTAFWVVFWLGCQFGQALFGNFYPSINAWRILVAWAGVGDRPRFEAPKQLSLLPFIFFAFLAWTELLADVTPRGLAWMLVAYTGINFLGSWMFGRGTWFNEAELFTNLFDSIAKTRCLILKSFRPTERYPAVDMRVPTGGLILLTTFFLSSTAFDGLRDTLTFVRLYWSDAYRLLVPWVGNDITKSFPQLQRGFHLAQVLILIASPVPFLLVMLLAGRISRALTRSTWTSWELAKFFAPSVLPVAISYSVAHYFTLIPSQGFQIVRLVSDPFGRGWNLLGTANWNLQVLLPAGVIWHTEVTAIVVGHIIGVYCGHLIALRLFASPMRATLSQLPMLVAMMAFTFAGLWLIGQPLTTASAIVR